MEYRSPFELWSSEGENRFKCVGFCFAYFISEFCFDRMGLCAEITKVFFFRVYTKILVK